MEKSNRGYNDSPGDNIRLKEVRNCLWKLVDKLMIKVIDSRSAFG